MLTLPGCQGDGQSLTLSPDGVTSRSGASKNSFSLATFKAKLYDDWNGAQSYRRQFSLSSDLGDYCQLLIIQARFHERSAIESLQDLLAIDVRQFEGNNAKQYARLMSKALESLPEATLQSYSDIYEKTRAWRALLSIAKNHQPSHPHRFVQDVNRWKSIYGDHPAYSLIFDSQAQILDSALVQHQNLALLFKNSNPPQWLHEFIRIWEQKYSSKPLICLQNDALLPGLEQLKQRQVDLVLAADFSHDELGVFPPSLLPVTTILLSPPVSHRISNLWHLISPSTYQWQELITLARDHDDVLIFIEEDSPYLKGLSSSVRRSLPFLTLSTEDYQKVILQALEIPDRKAYFEKTLGTSLDYLALPSKKYDRVILATSPHLARLAYPFWQLKSPLKTQFFGLSTLLEHDSNLDSALKGVYLPFLDAEYSAQVLIDFIDQLPRLTLDKSFGLNSGAVTILRQEKNFVQTAQFIPYRG